MLLFFKATVVDRFSNLVDRLKRENKGNKQKTEQDHLKHISNIKRLVLLYVSRGSSTNNSLVTPN